MLAIIFAAGALHGFGPDHLKGLQTSMEQLFEHLAAPFTGIGPACRAHAGCGRSDSKVGLPTAIDAGDPWV
jgi:hypothetical protein